LLHVADVSSPAVFDQISAVYEVLHELEIEEKDTLLVLNKIDLLDSTARLEGVLHRYPNAIAVSAVSREGLDKFAWAVSDTLSRSFRDVDIETGVENGKLMAYLAAHSEVLSKRFTDTKVSIHCRIPQKYLGRISESEATIRPHEANGHAASGTTESKPSAATEDLA
jgi:GTP-binding protein HflX